MGKENISPDTKEGYWVSLKNEAEVNNMLKWTFEELLNVRDEMKVDVSWLEWGD